MKSRLLSLGDARRRETSQGVIRGGEKKERGRISLPDLGGFEGTESSYLGRPRKGKWQSWGKTQEEIGKKIELGSLFARVAGPTPERNKAETSWE